MEHTAPAILELGAVLLAAAAAGWVARRLRLPAVVGYLALGVAISPFTPGYVADRGQLQLFADLGVVLLLFEVGIEVDISRLRREHAGLIWAAPLQTALTTVAGTAVALLAGVSFFGAAIIGLAVALSSSVVVVNITRSRRRTTTPATDRALLGWSVVQDVTGVILAILVLAVFGTGERPVTTTLACMALFIVLILGVAAVLPRVLRTLRAEHDLFLIVSVATGLAVAGLGAVAAGIPLALAAFVAGLAITESPDAAEARRRLLPFRDLLAVLFFVAIGTLIDPAALGRGIPWTAILLLLLITAKTAPAWVLARAANLGADPLQLGVGLGQIGEFSFVLASAGRAAGAISDEIYAAVLASVVISIIASTVLVRVVRSAPPASAASIVAVG